MARSGNYNVSYSQELSIFRTRNQRILFGVLIAGLIAFPFIAGTYFVYILNFVFIAIIGALGLNILTGYTGQVSLGHAAFLAVGAYSTAVIASHFQLPFIVILLLAALIALIMGLIIGIPSLRLEGLYLAMATLAFYFFVTYVISHWSLTGTNMGLKVPKLQIMGIPIDSNIRYYFLLLIFAAAAVYFATNLIRSRVGRAFIAVRDRDIAAETMGINVSYYKILSFAVSSFYTGIAGCLYAYLMGSIAPDHFTLDVSIQYIAIIIAGGLGSIEGTILGALFITLMPEGLRFLTGSLAESMPSISGSFLLLKDAAYGLIIILFLVFEPTGLYGIWTKVKNSWRTYPYKYF